MKLPDLRLSDGELILTEWGSRKIFAVLAIHPDGITDSGYRISEFEANRDEARKMRDWLNQWLGEER